MTYRAWIIVCVFVLCATDRSNAGLTARDYASLLGQGINLGNTLESPTEGAWGFTLEPWHFQSISEGGFDFVRVPIKWSGHASDTAPYSIDPTFFNRIDWVVQQSRTNHLSVSVYTSGSRVGRGLGRMAWHDLDGDGVPAAEYSH